MSKLPHIAIIILNWNGLEDTRECLESVFQNKYPNYSIYLIDNNSSEDELKKIQIFCKDISTGTLPRAHSISNTPSRLQIHYIQNKQNLGFAAGNNIGIRKALEKGTDYIFTLNNDTIVDPNFLTKAVNIIKNPNNPNNPNSLNRPIGIIATTMVNYYDRTKLDNIGHNLLSTGDTVPRGRNQNPTNYQLPATTFGACAGAALYSSKMLRAIGLFDPDFFLNYEDSDLSLRAIVCGWSVIHCPKSIVYHKLNASIGKIKDSDYRIRSQRNQLWAYLHNTPTLVILLNLPWIILRDLLVIIVSIITFRWSITWIFIASRLAVFKSLPKILRKRRKVMKNRQISSWRFWIHQKSWFSTYWQYFKEIVIKRRNSIIDT